MEKQCLWTRINRFANNVPHNEDRLLKKQIQCSWEENMEQHIQRLLIISRMVVCCSEAYCTGALRVTSGTLPGSQ